MCVLSRLWSKIYVLWGSEGGCGKFMFSFGIGAAPLFDPQKGIERTRLKKRKLSSLDTGHGAFRDAKSFVLGLSSWRIDSKITSIYLNCAHYAHLPVRFDLMGVARIANHRWICESEQETRHQVRSPGRRTPTCVLAAHFLSDCVSSIIHRVSAVGEDRWRCWP